MLDGRIDTQGFVKDLQSRGILESITSDEAVEARKEEQVVEKEEPASPEDPEVQAAEGADGVGVPAKAKKPRKLIEDEHREEGSVKFKIYKTYLKAS